MPGAGTLGKLNLDEFAMGSSNETSAFGNVITPVAARGTATRSCARRLVRRFGRGRRRPALPCARPATDTGGSIRQPAAFCGIAGIKPTYGRCSRWGIVAFASSPRPGRPDGARRCADCAHHAEARWPGSTRRTPPAVDLPVPDCEAACDRRAEGPAHRHAEGDTASRACPPRSPRCGSRASPGCAAQGAEIVRLSLPHTSTRCRAYYIVAPAEASSNLARYDGVRFGLRDAAPASATSTGPLRSGTRAAGFGAEVKRRIMIGTYVLSPAIYDAYYTEAQKVRALIRRDFTDVFRTVAR
jgi:aspartyl-tRNA(Asn)/glutamyl-tRNA(Gln) amidotransferase subunit A